MTGFRIKREEALLFPTDERDFRVYVSPLMDRRANGSAAVGEAVVRPGCSTPYHVHEIEQETWYVVSGHGAVRVGDELFHVEAGGMVVSPPMDWHQLINTSDCEDFVCVAIFSPSGPEKMFMPEQEKAHAA